MHPDTGTDDWLPVPETLHPLRGCFSSESAPRYHLSNRASNGLAESNAVRKSPLGVLLMNPGRVNPDTKASAHVHPQLDTAAARLPASFALRGVKRENATPISSLILGTKVGLRNASRWCPTVPVQLVRQGAVHHQVSVH